MNHRRLQALIAIAVPCIAGCAGSCELDIARADIHALCAALDAYAVDHAGVHPRELAQLLEQRPDGRAYLEHSSGVFTDPWKRPYIYIPPGPLQPLQLISLGADGRIGGSGAAADRSN